MNDIALLLMEVGAKPFFFSCYDTYMMLAI